MSNPNLKNTVHYQIDDSKIIIIVGEDSSTLTWTSFTGWEETADSFLLFMSKWQFLYIFKKGFSDNTQIEDFREFLSTKLEKQKF